MERSRHISESIASEGQDSFIEARISDAIAEMPIGYDRDSEIASARQAVDRAVAESIDSQATEMTPSSETKVKKAGANETIKHKLRTRLTTPEDLPRLGEIDARRHKQSYEEYGVMGQDIQRMLEKRLALAGEWMWTVEMDGQVEGWLTGQPTLGDLENFSSWEETTNNGTLEGVFDPEGSNVYVVNLTVSSRAARQGAHFHLMGELGKKVIETGKEYVVFASRIPGFKIWVRSQLAKGSKKIENLSPEELDRYAHIYCGLRVEEGGKSYARDPELRLYENAGFERLRLVRNGYTDPSSLNYSYLMMAKNFIPETLRRKPVNWAVGKLFKIAARHPELMAKILD